MPIVNEQDWRDWEENNQDAYGKCCVDVARQAMKILDDEPGEFDPSDLINRADRGINAGGITAFMMGCVAQMISHCSSRGEEFRRKWNHEMQIGTEGDKANDGTGVLNPALLSIG